MAVTEAITPRGTVIDLFSGTSRVGQAWKRRGYRVLANDHNAYAEALARCYVVADRGGVERDARRLLTELAALPGRPGYFTETFCERSRFIQPKNGARIDAIREDIARRGLRPDLEAVLLVALMEAADRVDSTTGVQMAYLKQWAPRSFNDLELRLPELLPRARAGKAQAWRLEAQAAVARLSGDVCYLDPPYNQHKYLGNYHVWESLVVWDRPQVFGIACKRIDCKERTSAFNSKVDARAALEAVIRGARARHLIVSFNNEGYFSRTDLEEMLAVRGEVRVFAHDFPRYVGARIGIHNPRGEKVGSVRHLRNTEYIYAVTPDPEVVARLEALGGRRGDALGAVEAPAAVATTALPTALASMIQERGSVSLGEAVAETGGSRASVRAALRELAAAGALRVVGATRGTRYVRVDAG